MQRPNQLVFLPALQHAETTVKPDITHDIEAEKINPFGYADSGFVVVVGVGSEILQLGDECACVPAYPGFVVSDGFGAEGAVPEFAAGFVIEFVAGGVD